MISLYCWNAAQNAGLWLSEEVLATKTEQIRASTDIFWIDLENPTPEEEQLVFKVYHAIHALSLEDMTRPRRIPGSAHFPKVEEFPDYLFVIVNPLSRATSTTETARDFASTIKIAQLSAVLTQRVLITHHYEPLPSVSELRSFLSRHEARGERGPDYLFHLILDSMVDQYAPVLDELEDLLENYELQVFESPTREVLTHLLQLKRVVITLRKTLVYEREVLSRLSRGEFSLIDDREAVYYRNVYDHVIRFTELIESSREMVSDLMQTHLSATSNRLNEIMKVLTMMSIIILPMTLIAGVYGMNFENNVWPDFKSSEFGFWFSLFLMFLAGATAFAFFRWKDWL